MTTRTGQAWIASALLVLLAAASSAAPGIHYVVTPSPSDPVRSASTHVEMKVDEPPAGATVTIRMAAWTPGDYCIQDHGKHVRGLAVTSADGRECKASHPDANTWKATVPSGGLTVTYDLPNTPGGNFTDNIHLMDRYAYYDSAALFASVDGMRNAPCTIHMNVPDRWSGPITPLQPGSDTGDYIAPNYYELIDSPIAIGECQSREFTIAEHRHTVVFTGRTGGYDVLSLSEAAAAAMRAVVSLMGPVPYQRYVLYLDVGGKGGGLEHGSAARIAWNPGGTRTQFLVFVAHEFLHAWNVKQARPAALHCPDLSKPARTRALWFCEGVTEYLAHQALLRAGLVSPEEYVMHCAAGIGSLAKTAARRTVTAEEASIRVWGTKESEGYGGLSYYLKGEMMGLCLDLQLRSATAGQSGLLDILKDLIVRSNPQGYAEEAIRSATVKLGGPALGELLDAMATTTQELPFEPSLALAGLQLTEPSRGTWVISPRPSPTPQQQAVFNSWLGQGSGERR